MVESAEVVGESRLRIVLVTSTVMWLVEKI